MLASRFSDLMVDPKARGAVRNRRTSVRDKPSLLRNCRQLEVGAVDRNIELGLVLIPAEVLAEQRAEVERLQAFSHGGDIDLHDGRLSVSRFSAAPASR